MFIIGWFVILVLKANHVVIPHLVSLLVGILAVIETVVYGIAILFWLGTLIAYMFGKK